MTQKTPHMDIWGYLKAFYHCSLGKPRAACVLADRHPIMADWHPVRQWPCSGSEPTQKLYGELQRTHVGLGRTFPCRYMGQSYWLDI
jgi:hypothetical protein